VLYRATIDWERQGAKFTDSRYSRGHRWSFDGGVEVPASSSPGHVPLPYSVAAAVDPEEAFVASLSSCHMLCFLYLAAKRGHQVDSYHDEAVGLVGPDATGKPAVLEVTLRPSVVVAGTIEPAELEELHHAAHGDCFIANSVKTSIRCEPVASPAAV
jgi:organic hydroperoxide reductase OsmC/OhrA